MNPFDFVNSINYTKKDLLRDPEISETSYVPYVINKSLSYFPETIMYANEMNRVQADNKLQYHYLLNTVRPGKRFAKWVKKEDVESIELVKLFYGYSTEKAQQALTVLTASNLHYIKQKLQRGGNDDKTGDISRGQT
jgi:hypothetical protein